MISDDMRRRLKSFPSYSDNSTIAVPQRLTYCGHLTESGQNIIEKN